jgi:hypothetical protein
MNWVLIGITAVLTVFIIVIRFSEVIKYRKNVRDFNEKNKDVVVLYHDKKSIYLFFALAVVVFVVSIFVEGDLLERISMSVVFSVLVLSEAANAWMGSKLYSSDKEFLYGQAYDRYRSGKTYKAKGKRNTFIVTLKNEEYLVPNHIAELIQQKVKEIKNSKK